MYKKRTRKQSLESKVENALLHNKTFSLFIDNEMEFKLVTELITYYLLKDYPLRDRLLRFADLLPQVKSAFPRAVVNLEAKGHSVRKGPVNGHLQWVTLSATYRGAIKNDTERSSKQMSNSVKCKLKHLALSDPSSLPYAKQALLNEAGKIDSFIKDSRLLKGKTVEMSTCIRAGCTDAPAL